MEQLQSAEVCNLGNVLMIKQYVGRLEVSMNYVIA
jgi:hypothetical protein